MTGACDSIADVIAKGRTAYAEQRIYDALVIFQSLLDADEYNSWVHYHVGQCLNRLGNPGAALIHLTVARQHIRDYKIDAELCHALHSLGQTGQLLGIVDDWMDDRRFWSSAADLFFSASDLYGVAAMWQTRQQRIVAACGERNDWVRFFLRSTDIITRTCEACGTTVLPLTFSRRYPSFLEIMTNEDLHRLIISSLVAHVHVAFASWDVCQRLRNPEHPASIYSSLPLWLRQKCLSEPLRLVFDASGEGPVIQPGDIERGMLSLIGPTARKPSQTLKVCVLTANSIRSAGSSFATLIEYSIYPILVAQTCPARDIEHAFSQPSSGGYHFTLLNGMPRPHRIALMILLHRNNLLPRVNYSWWGRLNKKNWRGFQPYLDQTKDLFRGLHLTESELAWIKGLPERVVAAPQARSQVDTNSMANSINMDFMQSGRFHIVSETDFTTKNVLRLTEKSIKPLIVGVPFVMVGVSGMVQYIRSFGFDLLDDFIDHSYDLESDSSSRLEKIVQELARLGQVAVPPDRLQHYLRTNTARLRQWVDRRRSDHVAELFSWLAASGPDKASARNA